MADMVSARSLQVLQQNEKELILAEGGNRLAVLNRSERLAEEKERMLRECIFKSKGRLLSVEEELNSLHRSIQQTCGSRRQGITLLRRKIETQNDKVLGARQRYFAARKAAEAAEAKLKTEEAVKADLCRDLSELVAQSADAQLSRLEMLTQRLMALNNNIGGEDAAAEGGGPAQACSADPAAPQAPDAGQASAVPRIPPPPPPPPRAPAGADGAYVNPFAAEAGGASTNPFLADVSGGVAGAAPGEARACGAAPASPAPPAPAKPGHRALSEACAVAAREAAGAPAAAEARARHVQVGAPRRGTSGYAAAAAPARPRPQPAAAAAGSRFQGFDA